MDVNSVLQNTRQYFQGVPSSSPASGELAPGASVGYSSPPVSSTATSTATSATNPFPSYQQTFSQQAPWNPPNVAPATQNAANVYHSPSSTALIPNNAVAAYSRNYPSASMSATYMYENAVRSPKMLPSSSLPSYAPQHNYLAPSITRVKESPNHDMYNMNSIVCQPNVNHVQNKKQVKIKKSVLTTAAKSPCVSPSMLMYKQPAQPEDSRYYNNRSTPAPQPQVAPRLPSILPSSYAASPSHQVHQRPNEQPRTQLAEQRVDYHHHHHHQQQQQQQQQQTSYHTIRATTSIEKNDMRQYYNYHRIETTAAIETAPSLSKRDSPLDLSVKTIRQSADSTAHDDFPIVGHQPLRIEGRHSHLPQLPYVVPPVAVPSARNTAAFNGTHSRAHYYPDTAYNPLTNGQLMEEVSRMPVSEFRNEMTVSITYEQKQQIHRTQVNAQISATQYSHQFYRHTLDNKAKVEPPRLPQPPNHTLAVEANNLPAIQAATLPPNSLAPSRKRRPLSNETIHPMKNPRTSTDWRESIDKEIENRLNAYTTMKAREEEERQLASKKNNDNSYQNNNASTKHHQNGSPAINEPPHSSHSVAPPPELKRAPATQHSSPSPSPSLWQHPQKAQHKLPVQPIQMHPPTQSWYPPSQQRPHQFFVYHNTQHKPSFSDAHTPSFGRPVTDLKAASAVQKPLPPFQDIPLGRNFPPKLPTTEAATREKEKSDEMTLASKKEKEEAQSRAALMASALTHPRIRTKAELKQGAPVDKSKDKLLPDAKLPESAQDITNFNGSQLVTEKKAENKITDVKSKLCTNELVLHRRSTSESESSVGTESKHYSPRKKLLSRNDESRTNAKQSSSETTVFEFRDSDSESENSTVDLHRLNDMRKDRKKNPLSVPLTCTDQLDEEPLDDMKWLEACDELILQFSNNNQKKRGRKKKPDEDESETPQKKQMKEEQPNSQSEESEDETIILSKKSLSSTDKFKKASVVDKKAPETAITPVKENNLKKEKEEIAVKSSLDSKIEERSERERKLDKQSEVRGQRSSISTTRIRIQNVLDDSSESEKNDSENSETDEDDNDDDDEDSDSDSHSDSDSDSVSEEESDEKSKPKKAVPTKVVKKSKAQLRNRKVPLRRATLKKKKTITSKKLKKVDMKREKMRHMILRRMETRKSKIEAVKNLKKAKTESVAVDEPAQPRVTRKMALRESLKENKKEEPEKKKSSPRTRATKGKPSEKDDKKAKGKDVKTEKPDKQPKMENERPETRKQARDEKSKKYEKTKSADAKNTPEKKEDEVTRRTLRSRNVVVPSEKTPNKTKKDENPAKNNLKLKSPAKIKKESRNEDEPKDKSIGNDVKESHKSKTKEKAKDKEKEKASKADSKTESNPSWEEELFKYKYSLRMPVKLINISGPNNWPKTGSGHASSLPDLDRSETDNDLLQGIGSPETLKKKNKDETKFSNTKEFKESVKYLQEKFDKKIEEKGQSSDLTKLMMEKKIKIIPKSSNGPELLPTPSLDSFHSKVNSLTPKKESRKAKVVNKTDDDVEHNELVEDSLIGYFRKETVDVFKDVFEKHSKIPNQFQTVILGSRTRTQTKELKHHATLKQVFGCDNRPASAPPVPDINDLVDSSVQDDKADNDKLKPAASPTKASTNGVLKPWHKSFAKIKYLMGGDESADSDKDSRDFEDSVDFLVDQEDSKDAVEPELVVKKKSRTIRRKCRSSGFDYIRKKKKQKKDDDDDLAEEKKKVAVAVRPTPESIEDIQNEIKSWVVNKGIGETVLHKAARLGYLDISSYCLEKLNCSPSPTDNAGYTPLHEACTRGHLKIAKMLLKYGADVSASAKGGIRPLHEAVENGDVQLVRLLLSYGADPMLSTYGGQTPLSLVKENQDDLREFLLLYLADIQGSPSKPWHFRGVDDFDREMNGYDPLGDPPSPVCEEAEMLEFEMSDSPLPSLYRFKDEFDYWVLSTDLPARVRDAVTKRSHDQSPSQYIVRKINRSQFEENVNRFMVLENKHIYKSKTKSALITMVKYNDKLVSTLNIQKLSMTFS